MEDKVLEIIKSRYSINLKKLVKHSDIPEEELKKILIKLQSDGKVLEQDGKYKIFPSDLEIGTVSVSRSGRKYIYTPDGKIPIASDFSNALIVNDTVAYKINDQKEAEIVSIADRLLRKMTCEVVRNGSKLNIIPHHDGIKIDLDKEILDNLYEGDIILVRIDNNDVDGYAKASFVKVLGNKDDPCIKDRETAINYGFDDDYSEEYLKEIETYPKKVSEEETIGRRDFRNQKAVTIDNVNCKDMDDGCYAEKLENGNIRVYTHISDVTHYVKIDSEVFKRACEKGTSLYMNNTVFHMLHPVLSKGICSLNEGVDRLTKTVIMEIDEDGHVVNFDICKSVINSKKKMNYDDVDKVIRNEEIPAGYEDFVEEINLLNEAALRIEKRYKKYGSVEIAETETKKEYNEDGSIKQVSDPEYSPSSNLIKNLMVCTNENVAKWLFYMGIPAIYRVHEIPKLEKINSLIESLNNQGYKLKKISNIDTAEDLQLLIEKLKKYPEFNAISQLIVMSMPRARYSTNNLGHFALALLAYLHYTSPIRRLPDLCVHMVIDIVLENFEKISQMNLDELTDWLEKLAQHASKMERNADMAEYESEKRAILEAMEKSDTDELEATVIEIDKKIRIKIMGIDTFIGEANLSNNIAFDNSKKLYYDKNNYEYIAVGSKLIVTKTNINLTNRTFGVYVQGVKSSHIKKKVK